MADYEHIIYKKRGHVDAQYLSGLARAQSQPAGEFSEGVRSFLEKRMPEFTAE